MAAAPAVAGSTGAAMDTFEHRNLSQGPNTGHLAAAARFPRGAVCSCDPRLRQPFDRDVGKGSMPLLSGIRFR